MRRIIENPVFMSYEEMEKAFYGKWILITKCKYNQFQRLLGGIPVVVADSIYEGHKDGFYEKFWTAEYEPRTDRDFDYDNIPGLLAFFDTVEADGGNDATGA